jgi:hypothetical protein
MPDGLIYPLLLTPPGSISRKGCVSPAYFCFLGETHMTDEYKVGQLYLKLYNGRYNPVQAADDYGFAGPEIGPLKSIHGTTAHIMLTFVDSADAAKFGIDPKLPAIPFHDGMLLHRMPGEDFIFYVEWTLRQGGA